MLSGVNIVMANISKSSTAQIWNEEELAKLKANFMSKEKMLNLQLERINEMNSETIVKSQQKLCEKFSIDWENVNSFIMSNTNKQGVITVSLDETEKLEKKILFNEMYQKIDNEKTEFGTNRLVSRDLDKNSLNAQQKLELMGLHKLANVRKQGDLGNHSIKELVSNEKDKERLRELKLTMFEKKNIGEQKDQKESPTKKSIKMMKKFQMDNDELLGEFKLRSVGGITKKLDQEIELQ